MCDTRRACGRDFLRDVPLTPQQMQPVSTFAPGALHSHTCTECGRECACYQVPCAMRGRSTQVGDRRVWVCGFCQEEKESTSLVPVPKSQAAA